MPESWDYKKSPGRPNQILFSYVHYTFARLQEELQSHSKHLLHNLVKGALFEPA